MIKAVFFDIDGTLLSHSISDVPESARKALDVLHQKGIKCVVASGRHMRELKLLAVKDIAFDGFITLNGQLCVDATGEVFYENPLMQIDPIITLFNEMRYPTMLVEKDRSYINFVNDKVRQAVAEISTSVPELGSYRGDKIYQAIVFVNKNEESEVAKTLSDFTITRWNLNAIDVVSKGASKVVGIGRYLEKQGFDIHETAAFGDGENDMTMLSYVGVGVAMGNADSEVKAIADMVTKGVDDNGIYFGLKELGLL